MAIDVLLATKIFGTADIAKGLDDDGTPEEYSVGSEIFLSSETTSDPVTKFLRKTEFARLNKNAGVADSSWDEPMSPASASFSAHSRERFEKVCAKIKSLCGENSEATEEAIAIARQMLAQARADVIAGAVTK